MRVWSADLSDALFGKISHQSNAKSHYHESCFKPFIWCKIKSDKKGRLKIWQKDRSDNH